MDAIVRDLRYAVRVLRRNRGFTLAAVLTLALGIGANTAIFTVVNAVLLRPLPFGAPDRLAVVWLENERESIQRDITSYPTFTDWRTRSRTFDDMAGYSGARFSLLSGGEPEEVRGARVTASFFDVLDVSAFRGRTFREDEFAAGSERVVVLSYGLWTRRFGSDAALIGGEIRLNGETYSVLGVTPPGFQHPAETEMWVPLAPVGGLANQMESRGSLWLSVIGRLSPNATFEQAQQEMSGVAAQLAEEYPANRGQGVFIEPLHETVIGPVRPALLVLLGAVAFVLLIACANVANLLLARGAARRREVSVRLAVGAGRRQLARQMLVESVVLALAGGLLGLGIAAFAVRGLAAAAPPGIPRLDGLAVDRMVVAFTFLTALVTGLLFGLAPAFQASRASLSTILRDEERGAAARLGRMRPALIVAEVALALVLLTGAGLMVRTFQALSRVDAGFAPENLLSMRVVPPVARYGGPEQVRAFYDDFLTRLEGLPGVQDAGAITTLLLSRLPSMAGIAVEGAPPRGPDDPVVSVVYDAVSADVFDVLGIRLLQGRTPREGDVTSAPSVAVVNETFVRQFLADGEAIGRRFVFGQAQNEEDWITVIGVVADARRAGPTEPVRPEAFIPHGQFTARGMTVLVRTDRNPLSLVPAVRETLRSIDAEMPLADVTTVEAQMRNVQAARRFLTQLLLLFAGLAAVLAAIGIYGVMAYLVSRRTRELGIRMAVGADSGDVVRLVLRDAIVQVVPGVVLGVAGALALTRLLRGQLYGVSPTDPLSLAAGATLLTAIALLASWVPAMRAARADPLDALRSD
jgi:putative ABC transport system permease protein